MNRYGISKLSQCSVKFSWVAQSCLNLSNPMDCSIPRFPVFHHCPELAQTHVHQVCDTIQPSHPLSSPSPPALTLSQHQGFFPNKLVLCIKWPEWVSASTSVLPKNIQDWFPLGWTSWISLQSKGLSRVFSNATVQRHQLFSAQPSLWSKSHSHTWLLVKSQLWLYTLLSAKWCLCFFIFWRLTWCFIFMWRREGPLVSLPLLRRAPREFGPQSHDLI